MARARNIKPSFFTNELLGTEDPMVSLTFAGLWCLADKEGILEDRPLRIKAELFPYRENLDVNGYLTVLQRLGFIHRYVVNGVSYLQVINFEKHQCPHHTEKSKKYPKYQDVKDLTVKSPLSNGEKQVPVALAGYCWRISPAIFTVCRASAKLESIVGTETSSGFTTIGISVQANTTTSTSR